MLEVFNINDVKSGDWLVIKHKDGSLSKDGSFEISHFNKNTNKVYGRKFKKRFPYEIGFDLKGFNYHVLCSAKEFKSINKEQQNIFNPKEYASDKLKEMGIEFNKLNYRKKVQVSYRRYPIKGDYVANGYVAKLLIEGKEPKFKSGSDELREFNSKIKNLAKEIQNKSYGLEVEIKFVDSIKEHEDFIF